MTCVKEEVEQLKKKVSIGDGLHSCTSEISFHLVTLRHTQEPVIFIDAPGLDDGGEEAKQDENKQDQDESIMVKILQKLGGI